MFFWPKIQRLRYCQPHFILNGLASIPLNDSLEFLLENRAHGGEGDSPAAGGGKTTPLHIAVLEHHQSTVELLCRYYHHLPRTANGVTPISYWRNVPDEIIQILDAHFGVPFPKAPLSLQNQQHL